jgi:hypothetical protein
VGSTSRHRAHCLRAQGLYAPRRAHSRFAHARKLPCACRAVGAEPGASGVVGRAGPWAVSRVRPRSAIIAGPRSGRSSSRGTRPTTTWLAGAIFRCASTPGCTAGEMGRRAPRRPRRLHPRPVRPLGRGPAVRPLGVFRAVRAELGVFRAVRAELGVFRAVCAEPGASRAPCASRAVCRAVPAELRVCRAVRAEPGVFRAVRAEPGVFRAVRAEPGVFRAVRAGPGASRIPCASGSIAGRGR